MRLGCCVPRERIAAAREAGFAFAELAVTDNLQPLVEEAAWQPARREILSAGLPVEAANVFFPGDWRLLGPAVDPSATRAYIETAVRRAAEIGIAVMVFGSGRARAIPEGLPRAKALEQLRAVLDMMDEAGARHGVTIAFEPLRKAETNLVHTVAEALEIVRPLELARVGVLADFYHMDEEGEPFDNLLGAGDLLRHVHVADTDRLAPGTGKYDYAAFFARLRRIGYSGRISVECRWVDWERESRPAVAFLQRMTTEQG